MCDTADDGVGISNSVSEEERLRRVGLRSADLLELMPFARQLANGRENRNSHIGFVGYNKTVAGNKVLIAVDREYDQAVPDAVAAALREKGGACRYFDRRYGRSGPGVRLSGRGRGYHAPRALGQESSALGGDAVH